ncbi:MAG: transcription termination factor Rho [Verrucomicrobiales bacterium]|nr:transcription termination factor Rho [Verrucomicrobiales bacterium]
MSDLETSSPDAEKKPRRRVAKAKAPADSPAPAPSASADPAPAKAARPRRAPAARKKAKAEGSEPQQPTLFSPPPAPSASPVEAPRPAPAPREDRPAQAPEGDGAPRHSAPATDAPPAPSHQGGEPRHQHQHSHHQGGNSPGGEGGFDSRPHRKKRFRKNRKERWKERREQQREQRENRDNRDSRDPRESREPRENSERDPVAYENAEPFESAGLTEISPKGFGFLRQRERQFAQHPDDVFITPEVVRIHGLRDGLMVKCLAKPGPRGPQLTELLEINGKAPETYHNLPYFEELTAINPNKRLALETKPDKLTTRVIDMLSPIGRGQRGLIVAPPRTGKTTFLHDIAEGILENYEDQTHLMVMLIDERPEEVTYFQRSYPQADLFASSNDSDVKNHIRIAQLAIERAKRLVEAGEHVFILLDSITRLARAFNNAIGGGKKRGTQSGGIAVGALEIPRKLFAAARNTREGGSLTIIATALIQTNFKMDDAIFQEFKGTGNMELVLDRQLAQNYVYPAVDIHRSGTRREELLIPGHMLEKIYVIRRGLSGYKPLDAMEWLIKCMQRYPSNAQMLMDIKTSAVA